MESFDPPRTPPFATQLLTRFRQNSITPTPGQYAALLHSRGRAPSVILQTTAPNTQGVKNPMAAGPL